MADSPVISMQWLGVVYPSYAEPEGLVAFARAAEARGLGQVWVIEDCFLSSGLALAGAALAATTSVHVGIGLLPVPLRNPALAAMELATVARLYPGRFTAAFGHGLRSWMEQAGAQPSRRLRALEEYVSAVRTLLSGQELSTDGDYVHLDTVRLAMPPAIPPALLVGTTGPRGMGIAGRAADGILLPEGSGPEYVKWAVNEMDSREKRCAVYAWLAIDDDPDRALDRLAPAVKAWAAFEHYPHPHRLAGIDGAEVELTDEQARELAPRVGIAGTPETCARSLAGLRDAGATDILLMPQGVAESELERLAADVIPRLAPELR